MITGPPALKDTAFVLQAATRVEEDNFEHYLGQKGHPMFASLPDWSYEKYNCPDWMHNCSRFVETNVRGYTNPPNGLLLDRFFVFIMKILVGSNGDGYASQNFDSDETHRKQAKLNGVFRQIWPNTPTFLTRDLAAQLRGNYIISRVINYFVSTCFVVLFFIYILCSLSRHRRRCH